MKTGKNKKFGCFNIEHHRRGGETCPGAKQSFAKNVGVEVGGGTYLKSLILSASPGARPTLMPWQVARKISLVLGCVITIFVLCFFEDYTERLTTSHHVYLTHNQVALVHQQHFAAWLQQQEHDVKIPPMDRTEEMVKLCEGRLVYVYNISELYNRAFVKECATFKKGRDLCTYMENRGMGRGFSFGARLGGPTGGAEGAWYNTWQFALELYFHERLLRYPCLTANKELANAFFVPFYAGMDLSHRFTNRLAKEALYKELGKWLQGRESWKRRQGCDHFMVLGRIASDFYRSGGDLMWGNEMLLQEPFKEMVKLSIERNSMQVRNGGAIDKEIAVPYPTYFHPSSDGETENLVNWLRETSQRNSLVTMAAGLRAPSTSSLRHRLMTQCRNDPRCTLLLCGGHESSSGLADEIRNISSPTKLEGRTMSVSCNNPPVLLSAMHQSEFCLQPPGDSPTRRSFFDAMLVGCIPVIFQKEAAWSQYVHYLPEHGESYSVFIPMTVASRSNVIKILGEIQKSKINEMRANIAKLIPRIIYAQTNAKDSHPQGSPTSVRSSEFPDAFDIALDAVLGKMNISSQNFIRDLHSS